MNANYELVMKYFITRFFPPKELQSQKRYLQRGCTSPTAQTFETSFWIDKMVEYLEKFPPFGFGQGLSDNDILELVELSLPRDYQKELNIQEFDSATQRLTELGEFCERLENSEEISRRMVKDNTKTKNQAVQ